MWKLSLAMLVACTGGGQSPPDDGDPGDDATDAPCNQDGFEPNDTTAFPTGVGETLEQIDLVSELCPAGDIELFSLVIESQGSFEAIVLTEDGTLLELALLTEASTTIAVGEPTGIPGEVEITMPNAPDLGRVLVRVAGGRHRYRLHLEVFPQL